MGLTPTDEQKVAIDMFARFVTSRDDHAVMLMKGSAGTGKTTLASAMVRAMAETKQKIVLLAPTGRAAKVFAVNSRQPAYTIHRKIYRQRSGAIGMEGFSLNDNLHTDTLFVIDEASMIANQGWNDSGFGSGHLLDDLVRYVYGGRNCRMMLIGDTAQLPPVGEDESPALMAETLQGYGLTVYETELRQVLRQSETSGILMNATTVRAMITHGDMTALPKVRFEGYEDIRPMPGNELIESLASSYSRAGLDDTIVITRSNRLAIRYNNGIRAMVIGNEDELCSGDRLMIVKNNYYWTEKEKLSLPFLANGDRVRVMRVRNIRELYGFRFADVTMAFPDYDNMEMTATVNLSTLQSEAPSLTREESNLLYNKVMEDYQHIPLKADRIKALRQDIYFNALQVKYAYAVTCHKAQGGQWEHVYVDQGYMTDDMLTPDYIHWLYTAFTRATDRLYLVNWPERNIKN
ncbi:MAG: AAA family ATPase [Prevotella sp.]|nr:AAA family ATPase [Prevotella sp.]